MTFSLLATLTGALLGWLMGFLSLFLVLLILVQRGKGGGLAGALGGPGGESAFGSKGADTFTTITIVVALCWGFTCALTMYVLGVSSTSVTETSLEAGPGDEGSTTPILNEDMEDLIVPSPAASGDESGAAELIEGLNLTPNSTGETTTPSADLAPADEIPVEDSPAETTPAAESTTDAAANEVTSEGESEPVDTTAPDPAAAESPAAEPTDP